MVHLFLCAFWFTNCQTLKRKQNKQTKTTYTQFLHDSETLTECHLQQRKRTINAWLREYYYYYLINNSLQMSTICNTCTPCRHFHKFDKFINVNCDTSEIIQRHLWPIKTISQNLSVSPTVNTSNNRKDCITHTFNISLSPLTHTSNGLKLFLFSITFFHWTKVIIHQNKAFHTQTQGWTLRVNTLFTTVCVVHRKD